MLHFVLSCFLLFLFTSCKKDPAIPEVDPVFQEKKRPPYNEVVMSKVQMREHDAEYQEVNPNFANDYQDAQREFQNKNPRDIVAMQNNRDETPLTIQKIRDDTQQIPNFNEEDEENLNKEDYLEEDVIPTSNPEPVTPQQKTQSYTTTTIPTGEYELQAGAYKNELGAKATIQKLEKAGVKNIRLDNINGNYVIRITDISPLNTRADASKFLQKVIDQSQHYDIMVVKK